MSEAASSSTAGAEARHRYLRVAPLLLVGISVAAIFLTGWYNGMTLRAFMADRAALAAFVAGHRAAAIATFALAYVLAVAVSMPGILLFTVAGGFLFGGLIGGAVSAVSATCGAVLIFLAARTPLGTLLRARLGDGFAAFARAFQDNAISYMLFLRLTPVFPFWLVNLAASVLNVRLSTFLWTTFVGILPATFAFAFVGAGFDSLIAAQQRIYEACVAAGLAKCRLDLSVSTLRTKDLVLGLALVGLATLIPAALRRLRRSRAKRKG
jgi:uncharacterized membrane protein YdjX (TVP38/TMEM64 family)